jgi:group I intron endonuclease
MVIYKITNKTNNKSYIGQTIQKVEQRWREHCKKSKKNVSAISFAIQKYKKENFTFEIIDENIIDIEDLNRLEKYYIELLNTMSPNGYNLTCGGLNYIVSDTTKQKMRLANLVQKRSVETINAIIASKKNLKLSQSSIYKQKLGKLLHNLYVNTKKGVRFNKKDNAFQAFIYVDGKIKTKTFTISILGGMAEKLAGECRVEFEKETIEYYKTKINKNA